MEMNNCCGMACGTEPVNRFFSRLSKRYAKRYRKGGLEKTQRYLLEGVRKHSVASKKLLDIGCGVGSLHLTLLKEGAATATGVDIAEGMIRHAERFAEEQHLREQTRYVLGDFVPNAESIGQADITMLDKVVCCYDDVAELVRLSTENTTDVYALSHPRENLLVESVFKLQIFFAKLFRAKFHPFWHDWSEMHAGIIHSGFQLIYSNSTVIWNVMVYERIPKMAVQ